EPRLTRPAHRLEDQLSDALGCSHDARRIDRFIRGDHDEAFDAPLLGSLCNRGGSKHVVFDRLAGGVLHQGDMLVRGWMEYNLRPILLENLAHSDGIGDIADGRANPIAAEAVCEIVGYVVQGIFVPLVQHEQSGTKGANLTRELGPDRSSGASDENAAPGNQPAHRLEAQVNRRAWQQIFNGKVPDLVDGDASVENLAHAWQRGNRYFERPQELDNSSDN